MMGHRGSERFAIPP